MVRYGPALAHVPEMQALDRLRPGARVALTADKLEILMEAEEADQADYAMFHRGLDQLENTTESLIVDVEATLRRLRDRVRA